MQSLSCLVLLGLYGVATISLTGVSGQQSGTCGTPMPPLFPLPLQEAWQGVNSFACNTPIPSSGLEFQVQIIAGFVASQIGAVLAACRTAGSAEGRAAAQTLALTRGEVLRSGAAEILASTPACQQCESVPTWADLSLQLIQESIVGSWAEIYVLSDNGSGADDLSELTSEGILDTITSILPSMAKTLRELECSPSIILSLTIESFLNRCNVFFIVQNLSTDIMSEAGAQLAFAVCDKDLAQLESIARAVAFALAEAVVQVDNFCKESDPEDQNPMPCELLEADIALVVKRQTDVFFSTASEFDECGCGLDAELGDELKDTLVPLWESAVKNAYADACIDARDGVPDVEDVRNATERSTLVGVSKNLAARAGNCEDSV